MHKDSKSTGPRMRISGLVSATAAITVLAFSGMALEGCTTDSEVVPTAKFLSPLNGNTVKGPNVLVKVATTNFTFGGAAVAKVAAGQAAVAGGHIHIFQDRPIGEDANAVYQMNKYDTVTLGGFAPGPHYLIIQGATGNHKDVESMVDSVMFTVTAP